MAGKRDFFGLDREEAVHKQKMRLIAAVAAVAVIAVIVIIVVRVTGTSKKKAVESAPESTVPAEVTVTPEAAPAPTGKFARIDLPSDSSYTEKITIMCTGDNLIHEALFNDAESESESRYYDFRPMYEIVKPYIEAADLATVNMETPLATSIGNPSGYPHFNSPKGAGYVLLDSGFDVINHANNHIMDMGADGVIATLDYWSQYDMPVVGAYRNSDDMYTMRVIEVNGISVAFLGICEFTNYDVPSGSSVRIPMFDDSELVKELIEKAKSEADVVVVHAHWGEENEDVVTETMSKYAQLMVDWGADIIFGNHTHIVQDLEVLTRESDGQLCPVILSNGNFISGQKERAHLLSGLEYVTVAKDPGTGKIEIQNIQYLPVVTHYEGDRTNVKIYPLDLYTDELAAAHGVKDFEGEPMTVEYLEELLAEHIPPQFRVTTKTLQPSGIRAGNAGAAETASEEGSGESPESASEAGTGESPETASEEGSGESPEGAGE